MKNAVRIRLTSNIETSRLKEPVDEAGGAFALPHNKAPKVRHSVSLGSGPGYVHYE
jgi:hypothetical protein